MVNKPKPENKKDTTKTPVKENSKKETKAEAFVRIAERRVNKVKDSLRLLGNCSKKSNYEYTKEQVETMFESISEVYDNTFNKFNAVVLEKKPFKF